MNIIDTIPAAYVEIGDQILIDGDPIEVTNIVDSEDSDEVIVSGYSHDTGDVETYSLAPFDYFDVWCV